MPRSCPFFVRMPVALCMALLCMLAVAAPGSETGAEPAREIRDLYYGDALFEFYQDQYFSTLTGLMVSQHFGRVAHHAEHALAVACQLARADTLDQRQRVQ